MRKILVFLMTAVAFVHTHPVAFAAEAQQIAKDFTSVAKKAIPAVVSIQVKSGGSQSNRPSFDEAPENFNEDFFYRFFFSPYSRQRQQQPVVGQASGFIVSADGYVITNSHVVKEASEIKVTLNDEREFIAKVIGMDPNTDVAILKIDASNLPYLSLGNSENLEIGEWAVAIGNSLGLQATLTVGVISAKGRNNLDLVNVEDFIQTDAAINRGNSGGPLLNLNSEVIGMNTAIVTNMGSGGYMGIGFAIPSNIVAHVMNQVMKTGTVKRGFLGVTLQAVDQELAHAFGLTHAGGALVTDVSKDSPADKAGLKQGDIIQGYNKQQVMNAVTLKNAIALMNPGTRLTLSVLRNGKATTIPVEIGAYPESEPKAATLSGNALGFEVQNMNAEAARNLGYSNEQGVLISKVDPNSVAAWAGLKKDTLILSVNQQKISNVEEFNAALESPTSGRPLLLLVKQGDAVRFISLRVKE